MKPGVRMRHGTRSELKDLEKRPNQDCWLNILWHCELSKSSQGITLESWFSKQTDDISWTDSVSVSWCRWCDWRSWWKKLQIRFPVNLVEGLDIGQEGIHPVVHLDYYFFTFCNISMWEKNETSEHFHQFPIMDLDHERKSVIFRGCRCVSAERRSSSRMFSHCWCHGFRECPASWIREKLE